MWVVTDSAADLSPQEIEQWGIRIVPLTIVFSQDDEVHAEHITPDAFYDRLRAMVPHVPTTSQPSPETIAQIYRDAAAAGEEVFGVFVSAGLSGTANAAALAAKMVPEARISVINSLNLSAGERFQVLAAAMALKAGWSVEKTAQKLDAIRAQTELAFTLETLDYLARGGRIGRVQALAGSIFSVKPIIRVDKADGKYSTAGRARNLNAAMTHMLNDFKKHFGDKPLWVTICHGQYAEKASQFEAMLRGELNIARLETTRISPVLGVHTGPGIVGAGVVPIELFSDLMP